MPQPYTVPRLMGVASLSCHLFSSRTTFAQVYQAFVPLDERSVAVEDQPRRSTCLRKAHWLSPFCETIFFDDPQDVGASTVPKAGPV